MSSSSAPIGVAVFPVTPLQQNCTLVWCRKTMKAAIIDPGASVDALLGAVAKQD
jgi:glyoxylase-like metal-dependent hydrolase (beta-lactamase superfamily II)